MKAHRSLTAALAVAIPCVLFAPASVLAAGSDPYGEKTPLDLPASGTTSHAAVSGGSGSLARTFIGLAVVVAVIYGLTWVLRQMKSSKEDRGFGSGLSTEASVPLGPGRSVHLIRAGRELVLVGSAEQGVVPIRTYTEEEARSLGLLGGGGDGDDDGGAPAAPLSAPRTLLADVLERLRQRTIR